MNDTDQGKLDDDFDTAGGMDIYGRSKPTDMTNDGPDDDFDTVDDFDSPSDVAPAPPVQKNDPMRPQAKRGRYTAPHPLTGKSKSWRRVSNFKDVAEDKYHLNLWVGRNIAKGVAILAQSPDRPGFIDDLARRDVKLDRTRLNNITSAAQDAAEAYKMSDEGTALHKSTELVDHAGGDLNRAPVHHRKKIRLYLDALAAYGIRIVPGMIERFTVSLKYDVAGTFDRICQLPDGSYVIVDLKTGDDLDLSMPGISAQLDCYENGVNTHGVWDGMRYDQRIKVRDDYGIVIHLPSTRDEVHVIKVKLDKGRAINAANLHVFEARKIKAKDVASPFVAEDFAFDREAADFHWIEQLNACHTIPEMLDVANRARSFGQWTERLAGEARKLSAELTAASQVMGS